jgi:hypothetical protein
MVAILDFAKKVLPPLEPKLLVMWKKICKVLKMLFSAYQLAKTWLLAPVGEALEALNSV